MGDPYHRLKDCIEEYRRSEIPGLTVEEVGPSSTAETTVFVVKNASNQDCTLTSCKLLIDAPTVEVQLNCTLPLTVAREQQGEPTVEVCIRNVSQIFKNDIVFEFGDGIKYCRPIKVNVDSENIKLLMPNGKFEPKEMPNNYQSKFSNAEKGEKPHLSNGSAIKVTGDPSLVPGEARRKPLTMENYHTIFHRLLWLDEMKRERNIRQYDMSSVTLTPEQKYLCLNVPGLDRRQQRVTIGDSLVFSVPENSPPPPAPAEGQETIPNFALRTSNYIAYVHEIQGERLKLKFQHQFHECIALWSRKYDVMFTVNRGPLIRMHQALNAVQSDDFKDILKNILFPTTKPSLPPQTMRPTPIDFKNVKLNFQQKCAVEAIVSSACRPIPYILFGPPGTGKTVTVVESILQVYSKNTSCKILACAPSNNAADLLAERLLDSGCIGKDSMIRLNAIMRSQAVPFSIHDISHVANERAKGVALNSRIIICTCSTAAVLRTFNITFSHVFVDEAGQATEPECLISVSLLDKDRGQLVLAGDPLQLGPVVFFTLAADNGLSTSMLERLMARDLYKRDTAKFAATGNYDSMVVTKLVDNYRSHGALLKLYSDQFYDGELVEKADHKVTHSLCNWKHLPKKGVPLLFHGIQGIESREYGSPSWFNPHEAEKVLFYTKELIQVQKVVSEADIAIITPYSKQVEKIKILLVKEGLRDVKVGSVEEFQGRESLVVIISTVRSSDDICIEDERKQVGFVSNPKRFNVAISRAQALLIVVGNPHLLTQAVSPFKGGGVGGGVPQQVPPLAVGRAGPAQASPSAVGGAGPRQAPSSAQSSCWSHLIQFASFNGCYTGCPLPTAQPPN